MEQQAGGSELGKIISVGSSGGRTGRLIAAAVFDPPAMAAGLATLAAAWPRSRQSVSGGVLSAFVRTRKNKGRGYAGASS